MVFRAPRRFWFLPIAFLCPTVVGCLMGEGPPCTPAAEACDGIDNDCDGATDEDFDLGAPCDSPDDDACLDDTTVCGGRADVGGSIAETCDWYDDDCDGAVDEGCECADGDWAPCGPDAGECEPGARECVGGTWGDCEFGVGPVAETCNALDDDCDGAIDEDGVCPTCGDGYCDSGELSGHTENCASCPDDCGPCCGNGVLDPGEECDDGNNADGDGCSALCLTEGACTESIACSGGSSLICGGTSVGTTDPTTSAADTYCCFAGTYPGVERAHQWTAGASGPATVMVAGSAVRDDWAVVVLDAGVAPACEPTCVAGAGHASGEITLTFDAVAGHRYLIVVEVTSFPPDGTHYCVVLICPPAVRDEPDRRGRGTWRA